MHQITLVSVALLCGAVWTTVSAQDDFELDGSRYTVVFRPTKFGRAQKYCRNNLEGNLADAENAAQLASIGNEVKRIFENRGESLTALRLGLRTNVKNKKLVNFDDFSNNGKRCVYMSWWQKRTKKCKKGRKGRKCRRRNKGGQTSDTARLFSRKCGRKRYFICETPLQGPIIDPPVVIPPPDPIEPGTAQTFTALGREYTVDFAHNYQSQFDAIEFCQENGKRLAEIRDQATLDGVGAALLDIQSRSELSIGEIATAERSSSKVNADVAIDTLNFGGWACVTLIDNDGTVGMSAQRCAVERGVLCEEIPSC